MAHRLIIRPRALAQLDAIADYTKSQWGTAQRVAYMRLLFAAMHRLAVFPWLGTPDGTHRVFGAGEHLILYRVQGETILVTRVLHQRQKR